MRFTNPALSVPIADTRRQQEEESQKVHNDLLLRIAEKVSPESGPIEREK